MGDRGNIVFIDRRVEVVGYTFLYTHWGGSGIREVLQATLLTRKRWMDGAYLCRLTFDQLLEDEPRTGGETGYGISAFMGDNEHDVLLVDTDNQKVYLYPEDIISRAALNHAEPEEALALEVWTFEEFASHGAADRVGV